jgi:hypothetical protein
MLVRNIHHRTLSARPSDAAALLDSLSSTSDLLWPKESWPRMRLDRPLQVGAVGGHGPIRYAVVAYEPGRLVEFRFTGPRGFNGGHRFEVRPHDQGSVLMHTLEMDAKGMASFTWPLIFRHLHDALVEDGLSKAQRHLLEQPTPVSWSRWVVLLRYLLTPRTLRRE